MKPADLSVSHSKHPADVICNAFWYLERERILVMAAGLGHLPCMLQERALRHQIKLCAFCSDSIVLSFPDVCTVSHTEPPTTGLNLSKTGKCARTCPPTPLACPIASTCAIA